MKGFISYAFLVTLIAGFSWPTFANISCRQEAENAALTAAQSKLSLNSRYETLAQVTHVSLDEHREQRHYVLEISMDFGGGAVIPVGRALVSRAGEGCDVTVEDISLLDDYVLCRAFTDYTGRVGDAYDPCTI